MADQPKLAGPASTEPEDELAGSEAPLLDHLIELRKRLIRSCIVLFLLLIGCFFVAGRSSTSWCSPIVTRSIRPRSN